MGKYKGLILVFVLLFCVLEEGISQKKDTKSDQSVSSVNPNPDGSDNFINLSSTTHVESEKKKESKFNLFSGFGNKSKKKYKGSFEWQLDQQVKEQEKRMKAVAKRQKKEARMAQKPQYSDPMYFGHKRKPKKHKPGKRKLCKECMIVH